MEKIKIRIKNKFIFEQDQGKDVGDAKNEKKKKTWTIILYMTVYTLHRSEMYMNKMGDYGEIQR